MFQNALQGFSLVRSEPFYFKYLNNAVSIHADTVILSSLMPCLSDHLHQTLLLTPLTPPPSCFYPGCVVTAPCLHRHCGWCQDAPSGRSPSFSLSLSVFLCPLHWLHGMLVCGKKGLSKEVQHCLWADLLWEPLIAANQIAINYTECLPHKMHTMSQCCNRNVYDCLTPWLTTGITIKYAFHYKLNM